MKWSIKLNDKKVKRAKKTENYLIIFYKSPQFEDCTKNT